MPLEKGVKLLITLGQASSPYIDEEGNYIPEEDQTGVVTIHISDDSGNLLSAYTWTGSIEDDHFPCGEPGCLRSKIIDGVLYVFYFNQVADINEYYYRNFLYSLSSDGEHHRVFAAGDFEDSWNYYQEVSRYFNIQSMVITSGNIIVVAVSTFGKEGGGYLERVLLRRSTDLGASFENAIYIDDQGGNIPRLVVDDDDVIYLILVPPGYEGVPFIMTKSVDLGQSWETVESSLESGDLSGSSFISAVTADNKLYVFFTDEDAFDSSMLFLTEDKGITWTTLPVNVPSGPEYFYNLGFFAYGDVVCFIGGDSTKAMYIYRSEDKGVTWAEIGMLSKDSYRTDWPDYIPNEIDYENYQQMGQCFVYTSCGSYYRDTGALAFFVSTDAGLTWEVKQSGFANESGTSTILEK